MHTKTPARDVITGAAAAGALATLARGKITGYLYQHEPPPVRERYEKVTGGKSPPERAAGRLERAVGLTLSDGQREKLAEAIHWGPDACQPRKRGSRSAVDQ
jgi:hypothetical protein